MKTSESIAKLAPALLKAQTSMGNASKDSKNSFFKNSYADLNSIREAVMPALQANGISVLQPTVTLDGKAYVETVLLHESGEFLSGLTEIVVSKVNDPQAAGSGISYARRYGLQSLVNVGAEDDDGESAMGRGKPKVKNTPDVVTVTSLPISKESLVTASPVSDTKTLAVPVPTPDSPSNTVPMRRTAFKKPETTMNGAAKTNGSANGWE